MSASEGQTLLKVGHAAKFVRWIRAHDRSFPEILHGRYLGSTPEGWTVEADGEVRCLDHSSWAVYR